MKKIKRSRERQLELIFQRNLVKELKQRFKGCFVLKMDPNYIQGIPDLLILYKNHWAALECKRDQHSSHRPNQDRYVKIMNKMSFARFIFPQNKERILDEMEHAFKH